MSLCDNFFALRRAWSELVFTCFLVVFVVQKTAVLLLVYFLRFEHLVCAVLNLNKVHPLGQVGYEQRFAFDVLILFDFFAYQIKKGNIPYDVIAILHGDVLRGGIGEDLELCLDRMLGLHGNTRKQEN